MNVLWYLGAFLLALWVLVVVHEFGHYLVARWCGVQVLRFSVGFGKTLVVRQWGKDGTEWAVAAFPLGGYVRMLDEREAPVPDHLLHRAFNRQSVAKRMAIVVAGPVANLLLAIAIYQGMFMSGTTDMKPLLAEPIAGSVAAQAGFQVGDLVTMVDDVPVANWTDLRKELLKGVLDQRVMVIVVKESNGQTGVRPLDALTQKFGVEEQSDPAEALGLQPFRPRIAPLIGTVTPGSPASRAGVVVGDLVVAINGEPVADWTQVTQRVRPAYGKSLVVEVERGKARLTLNMVPVPEQENGKPVGRLGIGVVPDPSVYASLLVDVRYGFFEAFQRAVGEVWNTSILSLRMIGRMIIGEASLKNLSGPVTIADYAGQSAQMGIASYLRFIALISISLGVLNLLPIPILDGGHLMYYLAELLKGSPVSDSVLEIGQRIGFGVLGLLMLFALYNDIHRLIAG